MTAPFAAQRAAWAGEHGWEFVPERTAAPDLFGTLSWRGPGERDRPVEVEGEITGAYGARRAFAHDRPLPLVRAEVRAQVRYGRISGVSTHAELPVAFVLLVRSGFFASTYPMPWADGLTCTRRPFGTATAVWSQPGTEQLVLGALAPLLQNAAQILSGGSDREYLVGVGGAAVLVGEPFHSDPAAALYRMGLADDVATRLENAVVSAVSPGRDEPR
ncbi:hypothetical protein [Microbacterium sp. Marseille-Q6965]|uniref:hypothetical protein n=1 Tax=Microbacterium sp. Marseille-Q6965 TaxID=2965072 RepID=UPI0021B6FCA3|nr:hypothetical protein [Microbacterium sp. Marseille-Q6965]